MGYAYSNNGLTFRAWDDSSTIESGEVYFDVNSPDEVTTAQKAAAFSGYAAAVKNQKLTELNYWLDTQKEKIRKGVSDLNLADGTSTTMGTKLTSLQTLYASLQSSYNTKLEAIKNG